MTNFTFIHTADWHLGHSFLDEADRRAEHHAFFAQLLEIIQNQNADALIVAGDIFDKINPSAFALEDLYQFLGELHAKMPNLQTILVAGNHDSALRLEAPREILHYLNVAVIGMVRELSDLIIPLKNKVGETTAFCLSVPFLRPADVWHFLNEEEKESPNAYALGVAAFYQKLCDLLPNKNLPIIATGHCFVQGAKASEDSERRLLIGGEESIAASVFPREIDYVALGHLHRAQQIEKNRIFYSGSALPLSFTERHYKHQVLCVKFQGKKLESATPVFLKRLVDFWQWPDDLSALSKAEILQKINELPNKKTGDSVETYPFLKIRLQFNPQDLLATAEIKKTLENKAIRVMVLEAVAAAGEFGDSGAFGETAGVLPTLQRLNPCDLFEKIYQEQHNDTLPAEWLAAFEELERSVEMETIDK